MLSEDLRRRIEALNRQSIPPEAAVAPSATSTVASTIASLIAGVQRAIDVTATLARPGHHFYCEPPQEHVTQHGPHGRYRYDLADFWPGYDDRLENWQPNSRLAGPRARRAEVEHFRNSFPREALFLDLETCGFAGSMVFLIGLVWCDGERLVIDQLLARNYAEEKATLHSLQEIAASCSVLVTFNGKSFDWPMVQDRSIRHKLLMPTSTPDSAIELQATLIHYDVLHHARRRWKRVLPNCKLQTLERIVCRRNRREDISGSEIPLAYHDFVRTGDDRQMKLILHHNAMDLVTLVQVALRLAE